MTLRPFHLAIPVHDLDRTLAFYTDLIGCATGRSSANWVDLDFFGHQLVLHRHASAPADRAHHPVDGHDVPIPHFGIVLTPEDWNVLADRLKKHGVSFVIEPYTRFEGQVGEQSTMFLLDPSGNALEFKSFVNDDQLFAT